MREGRERENLPFDIGLAEISQKAITVIDVCFV